MAEEKLHFQAEVGRLLDIVAHSLYSEKEIFLRELISNASDACDRLRYLALTKPELAADDPTFKVKLSIDRKARMLTIADNGVGMNHDELIQNLGTIARSGTAAFMKDLTGDSTKDVKLIGQFGVGFYSAFMVADQVTVTSRKAGEEKAWRWVSDGRGDFTIAEAEREARGTTIELHLREGEDEFLEPMRIRQIVRTYSDHIALPVTLLEDGKENTLNSAAALWHRPKAEITEQQYREFYRHAGHLGDEPWLTVHFKAEGKVEYTALLFVPAERPFDLFHPDRRHRVKLYVRRVFITDEAPELVPSWLRFLKGVVDSEDLPLNVSREMLQKNAVLTKIRQGLISRVLSELDKKAEKDAEDYLTFWDRFGAVLKEGLYEEHERRDVLLKLARFRSTHGESWTSLGEYLARMKPGQEAIYYITGDDAKALRKSPQIEGFAAKGVEVLLLSDPIDDFWIASVGEYEGKKFRSVTQGGTDLAKIAADGKEEEKKEPPPELAGLVAVFRLALKDEVKDVRASERLTESAVCLVADQGDLDMRIERMLRQHKQLDQAAKRIMEINPRHALIAKLATLVGKTEEAQALDAMAHLLLDQARIVEGETLPDPAAFARRLSSALARGLA
ncbi:MAG: molecular chaperone HtpG [Alphaproteobacteria bacterium]|nr:molecular chaperone HtpG [Alphaproteobacteria bacterium]